MKYFKVVLNAQVTKYVYAEDYGEAEDEALDEGCTNLREIEIDDVNYSEEVSDVDYMTREGD